jgi:hypothetical protein
MSSGVRPLALMLFAWISTAVPGAETKVSPGSLADAISKASEGDTLLLEPGVYTERVEIDKPLVLRGASGVILDGSTPLNEEWSEAGGDLKGAFTSPMKKRPRGLLLDGKFVAEIRYDRAKSNGDWNWRTLLAKGTPLSGFKEIRALWMYHPEEQHIYAHFEGDAHPPKLALSIVATDVPMLRISGAKGVVVDGLTFAHAADAVIVEDDASDCVIRNCKVTSFESAGIVLTGGATRCTVEDCDVTRGSLEEWKPSLTHNRPNYEIWRVHKDVGLYDRNGIVLFRAGADNRILRNRLHRVFDGIALGDYALESIDKPLPDPNHGRGTEIAHNIIEDTRDSGIELGVGCIDVNVHHNVLRRTHGGLRFKVPRVGPLYVHHNRLIDGAPFCIWISMDPSPAEAYVYHNTIVRGTHDALYVPEEAKKRDFIAPKWHFLNNLILDNDGFCETSENPPNDFTVAHNVTTGKLRPWPNDASKDKGSLYGVSVAHDENGKPGTGSAAIDAGLDLSKYRNGKPLPGCESGYFKGKAPDVGADEAPVP